MKSKTEADDRASTRVSLILATERLVAKYGVDGFTVRMLNAEAGVRNASSLYYHFNSREGLVRAVWEYRMAMLNPMRLQLLEGVSIDDTAGILDALVLPPASLLGRDMTGASGAYLRFLERVWREDAYRKAQYSELQWTEGWVRAYAMLSEGLAKHLSPDEVELKVRFLRTLIVSGLAGIEADLERGELSPDAVPSAVKALQKTLLAISQQGRTPDHRPIRTEGRKDQEP